MLGPEQHLRPQSLDARGAGVGSPPLSPGGLARAELACSQLSSNDGLLERSPRPAPPGRLEDEPRLRGSWNGEAYDRPAPGNLELLERDPQGGKAPAGDARTDRGRPEPGPGFEPQAPSVRSRSNVAAGEIRVGACRETKAGMCDRLLAPHSLA